MKSFSLNNIFKGDKVIWTLFFFFFIISIVEVYSASSSLSYKSGNYLGPIIKHGLIYIVGMFFMICTLNFKCRYFKAATVFALAISLLFILMALFTGKVENDASRWLSFCGIDFQPSEIAKGALVLSVAQILSAMQTDKGADRKAFNYILYICTPFLFLIAIENLSTAALLIVVIIMMMFIGRVPWNQLGKLLAVLFAGMAFAFVMIMIVGTKQDPQKVNAEKSQIDKPKEKPGALEKIFHRADTWKTRIYNFFDNEYIPPEKYDLDNGAQVGHANIAIASSGIVGKMPGNSQERDFLSQAFSDFIYAIIIEETGIFGGVFVAFLYIVLLFRVGRIANRCENAFPALLAMGLGLLLVTQALFNMLVAVGLAPVTGQPLPLISKGGSSTIINCIYLGMILSISRTAQKKQKPTDNVVTAKAVAD